MSCESLFRASALLGVGLHALGRAEREAVEGRYIHDRDYWTIGHLAGKKADAVRAAHFVAIRKLRAALYKDVLGLSGPTVVFLSAYYAEDPFNYWAETTDVVVFRAQERVAGALGLATSEVESRHTEMMRTLAAKARQLELHRRDSSWRAIVARYFLNDELSYPDESVAMRAVLSSLDVSVRRRLRP